MSTDVSTLLAQAIRELTRTAADPTAGWNLDADDTARRRRVLAAEVAALDAMHAWQTAMRAWAASRSEADRDHALHVFDEYSLARLQESEARMASDREHLEAVRRRLVATLAAGPAAPPPVEPAP